MGIIQETLNQFGVETVDIIRTNLQDTGTNATGSTSQSLRSDMPKPNRVVVSGKDFIYVVETGRKAGKPTPISDLIEWLQTGKASFEGSILSAAHAISQTHAKFGSKLFREGGRDDIITPAVSSERIDQLTKNISDISLNLVVKTIDNGTGRSI